MSNNYIKYVKYKKKYLELLKNKDFELENNEYLNIGGGPASSREDPLALARQLQEQRQQIQELQLQLQAQQQQLHHPHPPGQTYSSRY